MTAKDFARRVGDVEVGHAKRRDEYSARCPVCELRALSFTDGKSGLILTCYAGCDVRSIAKSLDLDLMTLAR